MRSKLASRTTYVASCLFILACGGAPQTNVPSPAQTPSPAPTTVQTPAATQDSTAPPTAVPPTPPRVIPDDFVAFYALDGDALDQSGQGHDGAVLGLRPDSDRMGNPSSALSFQGVNSVISIPDDDGLELTDSFTINLFAKGSSTYTHQWVLVGKHMVGQCAPAASSWILRYHNEQGLFISVYGQDADCGTSYGQNNPIRLDDGIWHNLGVVYDEVRQVLSFHVDCALAYETSATLNIEDNSEPFTIGNQNLGPVETAFEGSLDDVRIYSRALNSDEMMAFCSAP